MLMEKNKASVLVKVKQRRMLEEGIISKVEAKALLDYIEELETDLHVEHYIMKYRKEADPIINCLEKFTRGA